LGSSPRRFESLTFPGSRCTTYTIIGSDGIHPEERSVQISREKEANQTGEKRKQSKAGQVEAADTDPR
jgi:hypothetical protein